jgi:hypothetical protein
MLISGEMWQGNYKESDGGQARGQGHEERPFLDSSDKGKKDDEKYLTDFVPGVNPDSK